MESQTQQHTNTHHQEAKTKQNNSISLFTMNKSKVFFFSAEIFFENKINDFLSIIIIEIRIDLPTYLHKHTINFQGGLFGFCNHCVYVQTQ